VSSKARLEFRQKSSSNDSQKSIQSTGINRGSIEPRCGLIFKEPRFVPVFVNHENRKMLLLLGLMATAFLEQETGVEISLL